MMMKSVMRIVFDPGGANELVLLDWGQLGEVPNLAWAQQVQSDQLIGADWASLAARGNVARAWTIVARETYGSAIQMTYEPLDHDADLPLRIEAALHVRVLDLSADPEGTEAARTLKHYAAASAVIAGCTPNANPDTMSVDYTYSIQLGALVLQ